MRRMVMLLTVALVMTLMAALSASAAFAQQPMEPPVSPNASCGIQEAESHAPPEVAEQHIPNPTKQEICLDPIK